MRDQVAVRLQRVAPCLGRERELDALQACLHAGAAGVPGAAVVLGEAGIGKSTLLAEVTRNIDAVVVSATGDESETGLDYGIVDQLLAPLAVERRDRPHVASGTDPLDAGALLLHAFDDLALEVPLVITIDDVHLADAASLHALTFVARRLRSDRVAALLCGRREATSHLPPGLMRFAERTGGVVELGGLSDGAVAELIRHVHGRHAPADAVARVRAHTDGHPLHTRILLEQVEPETLVGSAELPVPRSLNSLVMSQLARCSAEARALIVALAILPDRADLAEVATIAGVDAPLGAVDELVEAGLVDVVSARAGFGLAFRHALVRSSVHGDLPAHRRAELHTAAARITSGAESISHRLAAATGPDEQLERDILALAAVETAAGEPVAAAEHFLDAAALTSDRAARERHVLRAADLLIGVGRPLGDWAGQIEGYADCSRRSFVLGRSLLVTGRFDDAATLLERAWDQAAEEADGHDLAGPIAENLALVAICSLQPGEVMRWATRAVAAGGRVLAATTLAHGFALAGDLDGARAEMDVLLDTPGAPHNDAKLGRAIVSVWANELESALDDLSSISAAEQPFLQRVNTLAYHAEAELRLGRLAEAGALAETAIGLIDDAQMGFLSPLARGVAAFAAATAGDVAAAREHAAAAATSAELTRQAPALIWVAHAWFRIAEAEHDTPDLVRCGDAMVAAGWSTLPEGVHHWRAAYAEALASVGRSTDAAAVLAALDADATRSGDRSVATDVARARGTLAAVGGDGAGAVAAFDAGLSYDAHRARPLNRARLELAAGSHLRRAGQRSAAAALLTTAADRLAAIGARPWLERCERELAACGLRPAKRSGSATAMQLTPQERVVAGLVADGRTNREVADELLISVKTVEHHLSRVYGKMGVRSRSELAASMRRPVAVVT